MMSLILATGLLGCTEASEPAPQPPTSPVRTPVTPVEQAQFLTRLMTHDNERRDYFLYIPVGVDPAAGVMFVLHGFGGDARQLRLLGFEDLADSLNMMVVYPQGLFNATIGSTYWNANFASGDDDLGFLMALKETLEAQYGLDASKTYMTGISNGGYMVNAFMCAFPDDIALAINWIGSMNQATYEVCQEPLRVPYLHIHGTADTTIPYFTPTLIPEFDTPGNVPYVVDHIASINGHTEKTEAAFSATTVKYEYINGESPVWLLEVFELEHFPPIPSEFVDFNVFDVIQEFIKNDAS